MNDLSITYDPVLSHIAVGFIIAIILLACMLGLLLRLRGSFLRSVMGALVCLALFNPIILREDRTPLKTVIPVIVDKSSSQEFGNRRAQTERALEEIRAQFASLEQFELREISAGERFSVTSDKSTALFESLNVALRDVPLEQRGGALFITDGQVHDVPENPTTIQTGGPLHVLLTGSESERDRRIFLTNAPRFGVVGEPVEILYRVEDTETDAAASFVEVTVSVDGELVAVEDVLIGEENSYVFEVPHGGKNIVELRVAEAANEITEVNNMAFTTVNGIRENLRVLLVSGEPHAGERTWRNLLKSDASVDLVHFTILRPPEKQDGTPINELSLIAFPTRELFVQKIDEFDLIIFDRYKRRGVLPVLYFDNIARYVQNGGAVLIAAGPEYAETGSIANTPLNPVLPAISGGDISEQPFRPQVSSTGLRHPVTRKLDGWDAVEPEWSRWFRTVSVEARSGQTIMTDEQDQPVLMVERVGEGRIALFLSDHVWLWARGFEGGGPHTQLLRRLSHWLMKEPELDEERLTANFENGQISVTRQTLGDEPGRATFMTPTGESNSLTMANIEEGRWQSLVSVDEHGLYRVTNGDLTTLVQVGPANPREFAQVVSTDEVLTPAVNAKGGSIQRLENASAPRLVPISETGTSHGRGWIGFVDSDASVLNSVERLPLFQGLLGLALFLFATSFMWYREGR